MKNMHVNFLLDGSIGYFPHPRFTDRRDIFFFFFCQRKNLAVQKNEKSLCPNTEAVLIPANLLYQSAVRDGGGASEVAHREMAENTSLGKGGVLGKRGARSGDASDSRRLYCP